MEIKIVLTADERLLSAIEILSNTIKLTSDTINHSSVSTVEIQPTVIKTEVKSQTALKEAAKEVVEKSDTPSSIAQETRYFVHDGSDSLVLVEKGESLDFLSQDSFDEISRSEYDSRLKKETQQAEKAEEEAQPEKVEEPTHNLKIEDVRLVASKLAGNGKQKELKEIFSQFKDADGNPVEKLSAIQKQDYPEFIEVTKAKAEELGL